MGLVLSCIKEALAEVLLGAMARGLLRIWDSQSGAKILVFCQSEDLRITADDSNLSNSLWLQLLLVKHTLAGCGSITFENTH